MTEQTTPASQIPAHVTAMAEAAEANPGETRACRYGGEPMFYAPADRGYLPGHVYSEAGMRETRISGLCEFHFDQITAEPEDD